MIGGKGQLEDDLQRMDMSKLEKGFVMDATQIMLREDYEEEERRVPRRMREKMGEEGIQEEF